jgi:hypothetical protein
MGTFETAANPMVARLVSNTAPAGNSLAELPASPSAVSVSFVLSM